VEKSLEIYQRNNLILDFLFYSGCRVSELANIKLLAAYSWSWSTITKIIVV
jgi:site-specific recombinase XerD